MKRTNPDLVCPHCQTRGGVKTGHRRVKRGVSGGKLALAVVTCGISVLVVGLSQRVGVTEARCGSCGSSWRF